jgi:hypothetical protein
MVWIGLIWLRIGHGPCEHGNGPSGSINVKFLSSCTTGGFSRRAQLHKVCYRRVL